uniref:LIM zinc-binding domain-containing protein n=1 Tax=Ficedula albicollis TaxID=59894 RepID=A0A803WGA1_FICAL
QNPSRQEGTGKMTAEGKFFHRSCFKCEYCGTTLRLSSYAYDIEDGKGHGAGLLLSRLFTGSHLKTVW